MAERVVRWHSTSEAGVKTVLFRARDGDPRVNATLSRLRLIVTEDVGERTLPAGRIPPDADALSGMIAEFTFQPLTRLIGIQLEAAVQVFDLSRITASLLKGFEQR
jgi:hypothetical protein